MPVRVLIVDDSALARKALSDGLSTDPDIEVVGTAIDPYIAREKIRQLRPDVLTLDVEMPRMDGITFLKALMRHQPMPVIVISSLTTTGSQHALEALNAGAFDVIAKPDTTDAVAETTAKLADRIKAAARTRPHPAGRPSASPQIPRTRPVPPPRPSPLPSRPPQPNEGRRYPARAVILIGASTGGTEAIRTILTQLPPDLPGIFIVQHIPAQFSLAFALRLNQICAFEVREAKEGDQLHPGLALIAPGGYHLVARWNGSHYIAGLNQGPMVHHQRPAVDVLFDSVTRSGAAPHTFAALLTGMGSDGATGLLGLHRAGAHTVAQNEETCVVYGMPREAVLLGAANEVLPLDHIPLAINRFARNTAIA